MKNFVDSLYSQHTALITNSSRVKLNSVKVAFGNMNQNRDLGFTEIILVALYCIGTLHRTTYSK